MAGTMTVQQLDLDRTPPGVFVEFSRGRWKVVFRCLETDEVRTEIGGFPSQEAALEWVISVMESARLQLQQAV